MSTRWSTPGDIAAKVRRQWADGSLLRAHAQGDPFEPVELRLRGPRPSEVGDDLDAARAWVARLDAGRRDDRRYTLEWGEIGGRQIGRNRVPTRAVVSSFGQAWALLGTADEVGCFDAILALVDGEPAVRCWVIDNPHRALDLQADMPRLLAAYRWLEEHRGSGRYLREISAPGVDTKFTERHRPVLAGMLGAPATASGFLSGLGFRAKPELIRMRMAPSLGFSPFTELAARIDQLAQLAIAPATTLVIENEITYLSVEVPEDGMVIWGKGFEVHRVGRLPWLADAEVRYWGDLDTHGFAILDRLRNWLPHTRSVLMDRETLLAHRDRWVTEERPATSSLTRLTPEEQDLYLELVAGGLGDRIRLEQERIDWRWVEGRLAFSSG